MKKYLIVIGLIGLVLPALAQNWHAADSLRKALVKTNIDSARVNILLKLAEFEIFKPGEFKADLDSGAMYLDQAKNINKKINSLGVSLHIIFTESRLAKERGQKIQAKASAERAIQILEKGSDKYQLGQAYFLLSECYNYMDPVELPQKMQIIEHAASVFKQGGYIRREAYCYELLGDIDTSLKAGIKEAKTALALYQSIHFTKLQGIYNVLGYNYYSIADHGRALDYELKALKAAENDHDTTMLFCAINNRIGLIYLQFSDFRQAVKYFKVSLRTAEALKDVKTIYQLINNISNVYLKLMQPNNALEILRSTLNKYPLSGNDFLGDCQATSRLLQVYVMLKQFDLAKSYCDHLLSLINHHQIDDEHLNIFYIPLIEYYFATKQYTNMLIYLNKRDALALKIGFPRHFATNHEWWFKLDTAQHKYKEAAWHLLKNKQITDSLFTQEKTKQILQLQDQIEIDEKKNQIVALNQKAALDKSNLQHANLLKNVTISGIISVLIIAGLLYRQNRLKQKINKIITHKNETITQKNDLLQHLVVEKEWLLKEVHHRVKNNLHSVISLLEAQSAYLKDDALKAIENSQHRIYAMSLIHQKLYQSDDVKAIDMANYIPELVQYLRDSFDVSGRIYFRLDIGAVQLNPAQAIPLGLIINEALTNSIKYAFPHGKKGEIVISLTDIGTGYKLEIADDGIGINKKAEASGKGSLGLELIKGLAKEIRGEITIHSSNGVRIIIAFERDLLQSIDQQQADHSS